MQPNDTYLEDLLRVLNLHHCGYYLEAHSAARALGYTNAYEVVKSNWATYESMSGEEDC